MKNALAGMERSLFWTLAFAVFAAVAAGLAARAVDRLAVSYEAQRSGYAIARIVAPEGQEALSTAQTALNAAPGVSSAAPMTAGRAAALLREWGGGEVQAAELPELRLVEIELEPSAGDDAAGDLVAALAQSGVTAEVLQAPDNAAGGGLSDRLKRLAAWGAAAFALVMALIVSLAARSLAARRREMVTVLCDLGATQGQVAGQVGQEAALLGFYAGLVGAALAGAVAISILLLAIPNARIETLPSMILPLDFVPLAAAPFASALAATLGARGAASSIHAKAARLG
ncbi:MAG: hypothetical protein JNM59_01725 [Hyphomonadaceae bacterium]|nr:hypothetical protein [Hyphomonadaceae bacterium]